MRKLYVIALCVFAIQHINAQVEQLTPLKVNPQLYYTTRKAQEALHGKPFKYLIAQGNIVVTTDTLSLPFVDDFSQNRTPNVNWLPTHMIDSFYNVVGGCLINDGLNAAPVYYIRDTAWFYTPYNVYLADTVYTFDSTYIYDYTLVEVDSTPQPPVYLNSFGDAQSNCLTSAGPDSVVQYWNTYFYYDFDTLGNVLDSLPRGGDSVLLNFASQVYFAQGEPNTLWFDDYAYVNNTFPINPPTIGVATLDGLNQYGLPYNNSTGSVYGQADYLTSLPIDLSAYSEADSIYLSFFFEAGGLGIVPHLLDSLIVEFRDDNGQWHEMWADTGFSDPSMAPDTFAQVLIEVPTLNEGNGTKFFYSAFQFRFRNMANLSGADDHWHIDYVKFDKSRSSTDSVINDIAFVYPFPTILKNFTQIAGTQFRGAVDLADSIQLTIHNLEPNAISNPPATKPYSLANELYPTPTVVSAVPLGTFNAGPTDFILIQPSSQYSIPDALPVDSIVIVSRANFDTHDNMPQNDTLYQTQNMGHIMAYDDGSAESAYGIIGGQLINKVAYEFDLVHPDTLAGFQIMLTQIDENVDNLLINFDGWDSIALNNFNFVDSPIIQIPNQIPLYIDSVNGFATYVLDTPIIISNKFYMGWDQDDYRSFQVGYDLNSTLGLQHLFYYTNDQWQPSAETPGSLMIRLILDGNYSGTSSPNAVIDLTKGTDAPQVYPNPTSGPLTIMNTKVNTSYEVTVTNMMGQEVQHEAAAHDYFSVSSLPNGVYMLMMRDLISGKIFHTKVVKVSG